MNNKTHKIFISIFLNKLIQIWIVYVQSISKTNFLFFILLKLAHYQLKGFMEAKESINVDKHDNRVYSFSLHKKLWIK